ncbi:ABC transporter substrate-binding protein [Goodfellowiella coeruleoviolacea]|uniref:NitT/TauT family transport system substrate-binding protein n=1 Tax=Goodfellowiella coeruleoviolacea TaxID=334858 RepID=A0AAE3GCH8_9PSEU|nr:ABC transporter substrate-binding protein [Goodfellowiella coeruleoviolacea]MCP2164889.1 NitT/TauT family transport system substrate-binding protein [Goodfellowiella coeruleoviolacea]
MATRAIRRTVAMLASTITLAATAGCGLFTGGDAGDQAALERKTLKIGVMPYVDVAPLYLAKNEGLFEKIGLEVELITESSEVQAVNDLDAGTLDVAFASNVTLFKEAAGGKSLQLQGEAYQADEDVMALVTLPGSAFNPSTKPQPRIAVNESNDIGTLATRTALKTANVDQAKIRFQTVPFRDMTGALQGGQVDAAWMVEPFITKAQKELGAVVLMDTARGATLDFPMSSYAASKKFADQNPRTLRAFRKVLAEAQLAGANKLEVQNVLPSYADVQKDTAALVSVGTYPASLNPIRLQRVVDLMNVNGVLDQPLDIQQLMPPDTPDNS